MGTQRRGTWLALWWQGGGDVTRMRPENASPCGANRWIGIVGTNYCLTPHLTIAKSEGQFLFSLEILPERFPHFPLCLTQSLRAAAVLGVERGGALRWYLSAWLTWLNSKHATSQFVKASLWEEVGMCMRRCNPWVSASAGKIQLESKRTKSALHTVVSH